MQCQYNNLLYKILINKRTYKDHLWKLIQCHIKLYCIIKYYIHNTVYSIYWQYVYTIQCCFTVYSIDHLCTVVTYRVLSCLRFTLYIYVNTHVLCPVTGLYLHISVASMHDTLLHIITFRNTCSNRKCIANVCNNTLLHALHLVGVLYIWLIWMSYILALRIYHIKHFVGLLVSL